MLDSKTAAVAQTVFALALVLTMSSPTHAQPQLTFDVLMSPEVHGRYPSALAWRPGHERPGPERPGRTELSYLWDDGSGSALWLRGSASGSTRLLVDAATLENRGLVSNDGYFWSPDGSRLLFQAGGKLQVLELGSGSWRALGTDNTSDTSPRFSPDGSRIAFVRGNDLHMVDLASGAERRLTTGGTPEVVWNGTTDWVYWEEIWDREATGFWWSPGGDKIAYYHFDDSEVAEYPLLDTRPLYPKLERQRYPKAGEKLPLVEVRVLDLASGRSVRLATGDDRDVYLARVDWHPDGQRVAVQRLSRDQTRLELLLCDGAGGECSVLHSETWPTWINLGNDLRFLADGRFIWGSEKSGWRALYLHGADGRELRRLSPKGWAITSLDGLDPAGGFLIATGYRASGLGAAERRVLKLGLEGGEPEVLDDAAGWHSAMPGPEGFWVHGWSDADTLPRQTLRRLGTTIAQPLPSTSPTSYDPARLPKWESFLIPGPKGIPLPAQMLRPAGFDPSKRYPVIMYQYGGPASQVVENRWRAPRRRALWHKMMAERGYAVLQVDNPASAFFGKAGEDRLHRSFGELETAAQVAAVEYLKTLGWVDPGRIGIWGWSGGGAHTLDALFRRPGVWRAGVAGAPVTDWRTYDAIWMERYLDLPSENAAGYTTSSPITWASALADPLLVIHGTTDNNVHPQNTFNLVEKLIEAGKPFELGLYPNQRHSLEGWDARHQRHVFERMTEFFDRHLTPGR